MPFRSWIGSNQTIFHIKIGLILLGFIGYQLPTEKYCIFLINFQKMESSGIVTFLKYSRTQVVLRTIRYVSKDSLFSMKFGVNK